MLENIFSELKDLLWGLGIISFAIVGLLILPKNLSHKLGQYPLVLAIMFCSIIYIVIKVFN